MRLRPALAALSATALLGLSACGSGSDDAASPSTGGSSAEQTGSGAEQTDAGGDEQALAFCTDAESSLSQFEADLEASGPEGLATILPQVVATLDSLDPPADIAEDFGTLRDAYDQLSQAATTNDLTTPEGQQAFQAALTDLESTAQPAEDALQAWTDANCPDGSASPTS